MWILIGLLILVLAVVLVLLAFNLSDRRELKMSKKWVEEKEYNKHMEADDDRF